MTDKEKIRAEIERLKESGCASPIVICDTLLAFIDSMQEETVSDDLKKFAEEWDESLYRSDAVIAGAKWHKQQMMKDAIEAEIINWASMFTSIKVIEPERAETMIKEKFDIGDKVKLIIVKED
jgi:hypothetical protein